MPLTQVRPPPGFLEGRIYGPGNLHGLSAEDRLDILDLTARFEWCFDARELGALEELLTEDAVIDHVFGYAEGRAAAMELLRTKVPWLGVRHEATNASVFVDGDGVGVLSFLTVVRVVVGDGGDVVPRLLDHALVTDRMRRDAGGAWRIARRTFEQMSRASDLHADPAERANFERTVAERHGAGG